MSSTVCLLVPVGSIPELPAESCAEIKAIEGENAVSGSYWLESTSIGSAIQAYCGEGIKTLWLCNRHAVILNKAEAITKQRLIIAL